MIAQPKTEENIMAILRVAAAILAVDVSDQKPESASRSDGPYRLGIGVTPPILILVIR